MAEESQRFSKNLEEVPGLVHHVLPGEAQDPLAVEDEGMVAATIPGLRLPAGVPPAPVNFDNQVGFRIEEIDAPRPPVQIDGELTLGEWIVSGSQEAKHSALELALGQGLALAPHIEQLPKRADAPEPPSRCHQHESVQRFHVYRALAQGGVQRHFAG